jgi:hypothetical protein
MQRATTRSNLSISELRGIGPRWPGSGASRLWPAPIALINTTFVRSNSRLALYIQLGEAGWSVRSGPVMEEAGKAIRELHVGEEIEWIGEYYLAQSLNRLGPHAFDEANGMLEGVIEHGPQIYRAKALGALGTNVCVKYGSEAARPICAEAARISAACEGNLQPTFSVAFQSAFMQHLEGDHRGALARFQDLQFMARLIARSYPALWCHYCNNLAVTLMASGQLAEAARYVKVIRESPFAAAYPEWKRTCDEFDALRAMSPSRSIVAVRPPLPLVVCEDPRPAGETHEPDLQDPATQPAGFAQPDRPAQLAVEADAFGARSNPSVQTTKGALAASPYARLFLRLHLHHRPARTRARAPLVFCVHPGARACLVLVIGNRLPQPVCSRKRAHPCRRQPGSPRAPPIQPRGACDHTV